MKFRNKPATGRIVPVVAACLAVFAVPAQAKAPVIELGAPHGLPSVSCLGTAANDRSAPKGLGRCSVLTMTTIYQTRDGSINNPTTVAQDSRIVALTLRLGKLQDSKTCIKTKIATVSVPLKRNGKIVKKNGKTVMVKVKRRVCATYDVFNEKTYFDSNFGGKGSRVRIAVLRPVTVRVPLKKNGRIVKKNGRTVMTSVKPAGKIAPFKLVATSSEFYLDSWFGRTVTFPMIETITAKKGDVVGLSVISYAPILPLAADTDTDRWRASRPGSFKPTVSIDPATKKAPDPCQPKWGVIFQQTALTTVNSVGDFRCSYSGVPGVQFTLVPNPILG